MASSLPKPKTKTKTKPSFAALSALINNQPWSSQLETTLSPLSTNLSKPTFLKTLHLITCPSKAIAFFKWAHQLNAFAHDDQTYFVMLEKLGRSRNLNPARNLLLGIEKNTNGAVKLHDRFFNSLIRSYGRAGLVQESVKVFKKMKEMGVPRSVFSFNSLFSILLRRGRTNMVEKLYHEMRFTEGISPDVYTFNVLIRGFCLNSMVDVGFRFFKEMSDFGCDPDIITYNTLVDGLCRTGKVRIARNLVTGMRAKAGYLNPNVVTYTTLIRGFCEKQCIGDALDVFGEMVGCGLKPNRITYNTLIQGLCEAQKFDKIKEILKDIVEIGDFRPDTCTFNTLMNAHCNAGKLEDALMMFDKMSELSVEPDSATYSVLIRSLCQRGDFERAEELLDELFDKKILLQKEGCVPLVAAYNPVFEYLCNFGKTGKAERMFRQLLKRGTQDPISFKTLILGHCKEGTLREGYELLVLMLRRDFVPDMEIYSSLIEGFLSKGESDFANETLEKMLRSGHRPNTSVFLSVLDGLVRDGSAREAAGVVSVMLERKIRQNINLSTDAITVLFKSGLKDIAFEIVRLIYSNGYSIKIEKLIGFLCQNNKFLEAQKLLLFSLEKHKNLDIEICSAVVTGLCKIQRAPESFALFYELNERGNLLVPDCLKDLQIALEAEGRSKEADFVSKRRMHNYQGR